MTIKSLKFELVKPAHTLVVTVSCRFLCSQCSSHTFPGGADQGGADSSRASGLGGATRTRRRLGGRGPRRAAEETSRTQSPNCPQQSQEAGAAPVRIVPFWCKLDQPSLGVNFEPVTCRRLHRLAKEEMRKQELRQRVRVADNEVMEGFRRIMAARQKKRTPTKKEKDQAWKALKERESILKLLDG